MHKFVFYSISRFFFCNLKFSFANNKSRLQVHAAQWKQTSTRLYNSSLWFKCDYQSPPDLRRIRFNCPPLEKSCVLVWIICQCNQTWAAIFEINPSLRYIYHIIFICHLSVDNTYIQSSNATNWHNIPEVLQYDFNNGVRWRKHKLYILNPFTLVYSSIITYNPSYI